MFCFKCGEKLVDDAVFCIRCGIKVKAADGCPDIKKNNIIKNEEKLSNNIVLSPFLPDIPYNYESDIFYPA